MGYSKRRGIQGVRDKEVEAFLLNASSPCGKSDSRQHVCRGTVPSP